MKIETAELLSKLLQNNRLQFVEDDQGLVLEHNLTDQEKLQLVELEYGKQLAKTVDDFFIEIMHKTIRMAIDMAKRQYKNKL